MTEIVLVGSSLIGLGIARIAAAAGHRVWLLARDADAARAGRTRLARQLDRTVARGRPAQDNPAPAASLPKGTAA